MDLDTEFDVDMENLSLINLFDHFNDTDNDSKEQPLLIIPYLLVCVLGLIGNASVLYAILRFRKMWTTINIYVFSLALGDILFMLCLLFFTTEIASNQWLLGTFMCKLFWTFNALIPFTSIYFLTIMSVDVFVQQCFPDFSKRLRPNFAVLTSVITWFVCLMLAIPLFVYADMDELYTCRISWPEPAEFWNLTFIAYRLAVAFLLPLLLTCIFLLITAVQFLTPNKSTKSNGGTTKESTIMISVLLLVFVIFWLPTHVLEMMSALAKDLRITIASYYTISLIPYLKSCIYPILYGFLSCSFKEAFNAIFCCQKPQESNDPPIGSSEKQDEKLSSC